MNNISVAEQDISQGLSELPQIIHAGLAHGCGIAAWQMPGCDVVKLVLSESIRPFHLGDPFENFSTGFIVHPFSRSQAGWYLKADRIFTFQDGKLLPPATPPENHSHLWLNSLKKNPTASFYLSPSWPENSHMIQAHYLCLVREALQRIQAGLFEKVVPSRYKVVEVDTAQSPVVIFQKLCRAFPEALVSLISFPDAGTWIGASPEVLVSVKNQSRFHTVALAGTKPHHSGTAIRDVAWTQKEIEEQAMVSRYIINCFKKIRLREFEEHGPKTVQAGKLLHLKTDFTVDLKAVNYPMLGSVMLNLLHPTSAVCGMPLEPAATFLSQYEGYDRALYCGFIGPVNDEGDTDLYVNLRCVQWTGKHLIGYAGCGVTADSVPENEWKESEIKINSLLNEIL
jgi:isochorismate synthase